jgi:hypothetical protein
MHCSLFLWYLSANLFFFSLSFSDDAPLKLMRTLRMSKDELKILRVCMYAILLFDYSTCCRCRLGKGAFGEVHLVRHKQSRHLFALKSMSKCEMLKRYAHTSYLSYSSPHISFPVYFPGRTQARRSGLSSTSWRMQVGVGHVTAPQLRG